MQNAFGALAAPLLNLSAATLPGARLFCALALASAACAAVQAKEAAGAAPAPVLAPVPAPVPALGPRVAASAPVGQPAPGNSTERLFGAWSLICSTHKPPRCGLTQAVATDPAGKQVVLGAAVHPVPELGKLRLEFRVSPAVDPKAGIGMKFQDGPEYRLPMSGCTAQYCSASGVLEGGIREALENGKAVQLAFMMPGPKQALVPLALAGFKEGVAALEKASQAPQAARGAAKNQRQ